LEYDIFQKTLPSGQTHYTQSILQRKPESGIASIISFLYTLIPKVKIEIRHVESLGYILKFFWKKNSYL